MKKYILIGLVVLASGGLLVACGGSSSNNQEMINGIAVPPDPGEAGKETLPGIDSNKNGIRDDVERFIAEKYGENNLIHETAMDFSEVSQNLLTRENKNEYIKSLECSTDEQLDMFIEIDKQQLNTKERLSTYNSTLSGFVGGVVDCE